jgi:hypothetical protein
MECTLLTINATKVFIVLVNSKTVLFNFLNQNAQKFQLLFPFHLMMKQGVAAYGVYHSRWHHMFCDIQIVNRYETGVMQASNILGMIQLLFCG